MMQSQTIYGFSLKRPQGIFSLFVPSPVLIGGIWADNNDDPSPPPPLLQKMLSFLLSAHIERLSGLLFEWF